MTWYRLPFVYRPRAERRESPNLVAVQWDGSTPRQNCVANISSSGAYLHTGECWKPGELLSLTLQRGGALENSKGPGFTVQARTVRRDKGGVGVSFLLPRGAELRLWESAIKASVPQTAPEDVVREFRIAAAIAFIQRISPGATERVKRLLRRGLSSHRLEGAIEIALHAEDLLSLAPDCHGLQADPDVVVRILEDGSWTDVEWIQHYWSSLLVTSCMEMEGAVSGLDGPLLLSQLTTMQARIFASACDTARKSINAEGQVVARRQTRSAEELMRISGTHDRAHIERDIHHLIELGLLEPRVKWTFFFVLEQAEVTPTTAALDLYARCHAWRGDVASFYGMSSEAAANCVTSHA